MYSIFFLDLYVTNEREKNVEISLRLVDFTNSSTMIQIELCKFL